MLAVAMLALVAVAAPSALAAEGTPTTVLFLNTMPAEHAAALYQRVLGTPPGTRVVPGTDGKTLVVRDSTDRLGHFQRLLETLDTPGRAALHIYVRPVAHRPATELAGLIRESLEPSASRDMAMIPDDILRVLVVRALPSDYKRIDRLARRLDSPGVQRQRRVPPMPERDR
ncbi:MAG: hypothetical protein R3F39_00245 [Myxococcota bacterium]